MWKLVTQSGCCAKRAAKDDVASRLVNDLLRDLYSPQKLNNARAQALTSIRVLAISLDHPQSLHVGEWKPHSKQPKLGVTTHITEAAARPFVGDRCPTSAPLPEADADATNQRICWG
jgi:hypothetical protein